MLSKSIAILFFLISLKEGESFRAEPHGEGPPGEGPHGEGHLRRGPPGEGPLGGGPLGGGPLGGGPLGGGPLGGGPLGGGPLGGGPLGGRPLGGGPLGGMFNQNTRVQGSLRETVCSLPENNFAGLFSEPGHPPDAPFVCALCTDNITFPLCARNASRCFPRPGIEIKEKIPTAFCDCKDSVPGVLDIYAQWVNLSNGGIDRCSNQASGGPFRMPFGHHREHGNFMPPNSMIASNHIGFMQALNQSDPTLLSSFECCLSEKTGLFDSTGIVNATAWHLKAMNNPDGVAANATYLAIDQCAASEPICNVHLFMSCVMSQCFAILQASFG